MEEEANCYCRMVRLSKIIPSEYVESVENMVQQTSEIIRESYQFWKAFCLFRLENRGKIIPFDRSTAKLVFGVICIRKGMKHKKKNETVTLEELERLKSSNKVRDLVRYFYITHYEPLQKTKFQSPGKDILDVEIIQMQTAIETHIKVHFYSYVKRLAFAIIGKDEENARSRRSALLKDLFENTFNSGKEYHELIKCFGKRIKKAKTTLYSNPQGCLKILHKINKALEELGERTFAWLPLRKSIIPASFSLSKTICKELGEGMWEGILALIGKMNIRPKRGFNISSIRTAGSSASIIFTQGRKSGKRVEQEETYIDDLTEEQLIELRGKTIVAADPNKGNILQMIDEHGLRLRYTAAQRRFETHSARYRKIRFEREYQTFSSPDSTDDEPIWLRDAIVYMKSFNSRTTDFSAFLTYVKEKNLFAEQFRNFYFEIWHRKFKFNVKINAKRSRDLFLNRFDELYGSSKNTVLCIGDWEQRPGMSFGKAPSMGIGIRNWFRKRNYPVYLVDECRTSLTCCDCKEENEYKWQRRKDPRPWKKGKTQKVWGLSRCKNSQCRIVHNRDVNSSKNILEICLCHISLQGRPDYFKRNHHNCASVESDSTKIPTTGDLAVDETEQKCEASHSV